MAEQWAEFLASGKAHAQPSVRFPFENCFRSSAEKYEVPLVLLLAVARGESDFDPYAVSHADARGLMQIHWPSTAGHLGLRDEDAFDPCKNVDAGSRYIRELLERYNNNLHLALAAYNYGPGRIAVGAESIPEQADWYSRYIFDHLSYVTSGTDSGVTVASYDEERKRVIIEFTHPYLAERFIERMSGSAPQARLDLFKTYFSRYRVVLLYASDAEFRRSRDALDRAGFRIDDEV